jgi:hypothetical protein
MIKAQRVGSARSVDAVRAPPSEYGTCRSTEIDVHLVGVKKVGLVGLMRPYMVGDRRRC